MLIREEDLEKYAMQSLQTPAAPPLPQLGLPAPKPATTVTEIPSEEASAPTKGKNSASEQKQEVPIALARVKEFKSVRDFMEALG